MKSHHVILTTPEKENTTNTTTSVPVEVLEECLYLVE